MNENEEVYYRNQKGSVFLQKEHQDRTWTGKMFVPDTELFKDPTTDSSYFGTFNRITVYANKNTREDRCSFLFQSNFCGFVCNHFTFCQQLYNANSHRGWKTPLNLPVQPSWWSLNRVLKSATSSQVWSISTDRDFTTSPGILLPPHSRSVSSSVQMEFCVLSFVPLSLLLSLGTTEKSLASSYSFLSSRYIQTWIKKIFLSLQA